MSRRGAAARRYVAGLLGLGLSLGCPTSDPARGGGEGDPSAASPPTPTPTEPPEEFRREAHGKALAALREQARPMLQVLDPVAHAEVADGPLSPPGFGAGSRNTRRAALDAAERESEGIKATLLSPEDGMVLGALDWAIQRGRAHLTRPPWRDDPRAVLHALHPYLDAVERRRLAGGCEDGCGLEQLAPALRAGFDEIGSASLPTVLAAREDLDTLRRWLDRITAGRPDEHPWVKARPELEATLTTLTGRLDAAASALGDAPMVPWDRAVAPAPAPSWTRRPPRWGRERLRAWLGEEEAYGVEPKRLLSRVVATLEHLAAMESRDAKGTGEDAPVPRPFDAAACEAVWDPLEAWAKEQGPPMIASLDCATVVAGLPPAVDSEAAFVLHLVEHGIVRPTRRAVRSKTAPDLAMVSGHLGATGQALVMLIAVTAGTGRHRAAELLALDRAQRRLCLTAAALWIHGELGEPEQLAERLAGRDCGPIDELVAIAEARPRASLDGLGLTLIGSGPADVAALDRFWWAPLGLVVDLARPPTPPVQGPATVEDLDPASLGSGG